jgi:hypothetical protein
MVASLDAENAGAAWGGAIMGVPLLVFKRSNQFPPACSVATGDRSFMNG